MLSLPEPRFDPWLGNEDSASCPMWHGQTKTNRQTLWRVVWMIVCALCVITCGVHTELSVLTQLVAQVNRVALGQDKQLLHRGMMSVLSTLTMMSKLPWKWLSIQSCQNGTEDKHIPHDWPKSLNARTESQM